MPKKAVYKLKAAADVSGVTIRRDLFLAEILYKTEEYPDLRTFYSQFEAKVQEPIVLKATSTATSVN